MNAISTYGSLLYQMSAINNTSSLSNKFSAQLSSGLKSQDLSGNPDHITILDLTGTTNKLTSYAKTCTLASITTSEYTNSLSSIETLTTTAKKAIMGLVGTYQGIPSNDGTSPGTLSAFTDLGATITQTMKELEISLNEQAASGGAYLYSGLRDPSQQAQVAGVTNPGTLYPYSIPPVTDSTTWTAFTNTPPAVDPIATNNGSATDGLPMYDADTANGGVQAVRNMAYGTKSVTIDDKETLSLNITSNDQAFQSLINGLRAAKTACDNASSPAFSTSDRDTYINLAFSNVSKALDGVRALENKNSINTVTLNNKLTQHTNTLNLIGTRLNNLTAVDQTTATVQLAAANNQLQASYKVTGTMLGLSLMNYLK